MRKFRVIFMRGHYVLFGMTVEVEHPRGGGDAIIDACIKIGEGGKHLLEGCTHIETRDAE